MANTVVVAGSNYTVADVNEKNWGQNTTDLLIALAAAVGSGSYLAYVAVASSPISVVSGKTYLVDTSAARTLNLPAPAMNAYFWIKDVTGTAATFNITLHRNGTEKIDGVTADKTLSINGGHWYFLSDGTDWFMIRDVEGFNPKAATNQIVLTPGAFSVTITAPVPAAARVLTIPDPGTAASFLMTEGAATVNGVKSFASSALKINGVSGGFSAAIAGAAFAAARVYTVPDVLIAADFLMTEGAQTVNGAKSFASSALKLNGASGGFAATIANAAFAAARIYTVPDALADASFVMTEGVQTINGAKTFASLKGTMGADIAAATFKFTGLGAGSADGHSVRYEQVKRLWTYKRPVLQWVSVSTVDVEPNDPASTTTRGILFPDGDYRTNTTSSFYRFDITRNCSLTGTKLSGLRATLTEAANTWYALYAVKASDNTTDWVTVGDTLFPIQANKATLDSNFGANSWVYLGMIANGDNAAATSDIVTFTQNGNITQLQNSLSANVVTACGIRMTTTASAALINYNGASGGSTSNQSPDNIVQHHYQVQSLPAAGQVMIVENNSGTFTMTRALGNGSSIAHRVWASKSIGVKVSNSGGGSSAMDIILAGWVDSALGVGPNPVV